MGAGEISSRSLVSYVFALIVLIGIVVFVLANREVYTYLLQVDASVFLLFASVFLVGALNQSVFQYVVCRGFHYSLGFIESFLLIALMFTGNFFTPFKAGTVFRAVYLKQISRIPYSFFASMFIALYYLSMSVTFLFGFACVLAYWIRSGHFLPYLTGIFAASILSMILAMIVMDIRPSRILKIPLVQRLAHRMSAFDPKSMVRNPVYYLIAAIGRLAVLVILAFAYKAAFASLHIPISLEASAVISSLGTVLFFVQIIPGNIGIYEALIAILATHFGISPEASFAAAVVFRISQFCVYVALGPASWVLLRYRSARVRTYKKRYTPSKT